MESYSVQNTPIIGVSNDMGALWPLLDSLNIGALLDIRT